MKIKSLVYDREGKLIDRKITDNATEIPLLMNGIYHLIHADIRVGIAVYSTEEVKTDG